MILSILRLVVGLIEAGHHDLDFHRAVISSAEAVLLINNGIKANCKGDGLVLIRFLCARVRSSMGRDDYWLRHTHALHVLG